jgi:hypothetical protein
MVIPIRRMVVQTIGSGRNTKLSTVNERLLLAEGRRSLSGYGSPLWTLFGPWSTESERLFSPKETLKLVTWASAIGT